ncbi:MAG: hypothetical protein F4Z25_01050 [Chloroflexi bacterium]|nr:hypothetical protein [Chloroflexota bacterium]
MPATRRGQVVRRRAGLPARVASLVPARALPVLRTSLLVAGAAFAAEFALRAAIGGSLLRLLSPFRSSAAITRTEITEWLIVERFRRRQG